MYGSSTPFFTAPLKQALRWNLVARNVADLVTPPRDQHKEMKTLDIEAGEAAYWRCSWRPLSKPFMFLP